MARNVRITRIIAKTESVAYQLQNLHFSNFRPPAETWEPQVNAYLYEDRYEICVDLAGVEKSDIDIQVDRGRLVIRGTRQPPGPAPCLDSPCRQVLAMEIESGPFGRSIRIPDEIDPEKISARQENGLLWITLPLSS